MNVYKCVSQVLLWFYDVGLLPECQELEDEQIMPQLTLSMKIPYPRKKLAEWYAKRRGANANEDKFFIDKLITLECLPLRAQWEREAGTEFPNHGGNYPPPSLQSLLRSYLIDCHNQDDEDQASSFIVDEDNNSEERDQAETESKHSVTIYLLMDLAMLLQSSHPSIDRLIKYPSAFKLSPSSIKLTQAFWLLDHEDYEGFFKIMTGELILPSDIGEWMHKLAVDTLLRNCQHKFGESWE